MQRKTLFNLNVNLWFSGKASSMQCVYFWRAACWVCKHNAISQDKMSTALFYCWALPNISESSEVSGQQCVALKGLLMETWRNNYMKKKDLWTIKWSCNKLLVLRSVVIEVRTWSWQSGNLTAFPEGGSFCCFFPRCREAPCGLVGPFSAIPYPCPHNHHRCITVVSMIPWHLAQTSDITSYYNSLFTGWCLWTVGMSQCDVISY